MGWKRTWKRGRTTLTYGVKADEQLGGGGPAGRRAGRHDGALSRLSAILEAAEGQAQVVSAVPARKVELEWWTRQPCNPL